MAGEGHREWVAELGEEVKSLHPHSGVSFTPVEHPDASSACLAFAPPCPKEQIPLQHPNGSSGEFP